MINVHIRNKFVDYKFNLWQKYNLLTGDSGEGKTTLYKMIASYDENKQNIQCLGYKKLGTDLTLLRTLADIAMEDDDKVKEDLIHRLDGFLIILDENSSLLKRRSAPSLLERFNCYFLVICRKVALGFKSVSADCVFELSSSGKFHTFKPHYKEPLDRPASWGVLRQIDWADRNKGCSLASLRRFLLEAQLQIGSRSSAFSSGKGAAIYKIVIPRVYIGTLHGVLLCSGCVP